MNGPHRLHYHTSPLKELFLYSDMAEAKSLLESIARSYGYRLGKLNNSRVNTISQSPTITTAGSELVDFKHF